MASNDGFQPGDYVVINVNGDNVEARPIAALGSLIFDAPLAKAHAVGEPVRAFVCQGAPLAAAFTCSDAGVGVETCGEDVKNGQALDTSTAGAKQTTIRAWDLAGNVTEKTVAWTVGVCASEIDSFRCYQAKPGDEFTIPPKRVTLKKLIRLCTPVGVDGGATKHSAHLLCFQVAATKGRCADVAPSNAGGGCKKETDCGGTKGQTTLCGDQAKFTKQTGRHVLNDLAAGTLDAAKEDVLCLPALLTP